MKTINLSGSALPLTLASFLAAGGGAYGAGSDAGTDKANLAVTASITSHCAISAVPAASGAVTTVCTNGSAAVVNSGQGANIAGSTDATVTGSTSAPIVYQRMPSNRNQPAGAGIVVATVTF